MELLGSIYRGILDLIYPPKCLVCEEIQEFYLCPDCLSKIDRIGPVCCDRCGAPIESEVCWECRGKRFRFDSTRCYGYYTGILREAIHRFKYSGCRQIAPELGNLLVAVWKETTMPSVDGIVPMPIHRRRQRERGFNQSTLLAEVVSRGLRLPVLRRAIVRIRPTPPQVDLPPEERALNVKGAFGIDHEDVTDMNLILIDDVFTTGSTLDEAAGTLKAAGAQSVHALVLARSI